MLIFTVLYSASLKILFVRSKNVHKVYTIPRWYTVHYTQMVYSTLYPDGIQYSAIFKAFKNAKMEDNLFFILDNMSETGKVKFRVQFSPWQV